MGGQDADSNTTQTETTGGKAPAGHRASTVATVSPGSCDRPATRSTPQIRSSADGDAIRLNLADAAAHTVPTPRGIT